MYVPYFAHAYTTIYLPSFPLEVVSVQQTPEFQNNYIRPFCQCKCCLGGEPDSWVFLLHCIFPESPPTIPTILPLKYHLNMFHHLSPSQVKPPEKTTALANSLTVTSGEALTKTLHLTKL